MFFAQMSAVRAASQAFAGRSLLPLRALACQSAPRSDFSSRRREDGWHGWRHVLSGALGSAAFLYGHGQGTTACESDAKTVKKAVMSGPLGTLPPAPNRVAEKVPAKDPKGRPRVAFQGELGAYSETAVWTRWGEGNAIPVPCENFDELVSLVSTGQVERGLIPVENSLAGSLHKNYDLLIQHSELSIVGEVTIPIAHCLLALPGTQMKDVTRVLSHPVALAQCERFLEANGLNSEVAYDTAGSARIVSEQKLKNAAAIAGQGAATRYGLEVLRTHVQDESNNFTRFLVISREKAEVRKGKPARTSLIVGLTSKPGSLVHVLTILSMRGLDMTKLESRPVNSLNEESRTLVQLQLENAIDADQFPVIFLIDVSGSMADKPMRNALAHMLEEPIFLRVLGSYEL